MNNSTLSKSEKLYIVEIVNRVENNEEITLYPKKTQVFCMSICGAILFLFLFWMSIINTKLLHDLFFVLMLVLVAILSLYYLTCFLTSDGKIILNSEKLIINTCFGTNSFEWMQIARIEFLTSRLFNHLFIEKIPHKQKKRLTKYSYASLSVLGFYFLTE